MTRAFAAAAVVALLAAAACGKFGPPVRTRSEPAATPPAVSAAPGAVDTEECPDPNAPAAAPDTGPQP